MRKSFKKAAAAALVAVVAFSYSLGVAGTVSSAALSKAAKKAAKQEYDPAGEYHAYFGFQMAGTWIFRDPWYSEELGLEGTKFTGDATFSDFTRSGDDGPVKLDGTVTDAVITGNGTYSVKVEGINDILNTAVKEPDVSDPKIAMLYVDTDIPVDARDAGFTISNVKVLIDGNEISGVAADPFYPEEYEDKDTKNNMNANGGLIRFDAINTYQTDQGAYKDGITDLQPYPTDSMEIQFEVSGMTNDNPDAVIEEPEPETNGDSSAASEESSESGLEDTPDGISGGTIAIVVVVIAAIVVVIVLAVNATKKKDE